MPVDGYSPSARKDIFSDGTPYSGRPIALEKLSAEEMNALKYLIRERNSRRTKLQFNPTAGSVHSLESSGQWRQAATLQISSEAQRAKKEQGEKRVWGLARQTHQGLLKNLGINYGIAEIATRLRLAQQQRDLEKEGRVLERKDIEAAALLVAVEQYDLNRVAATLGLKTKLPMAPL